MNLDRKIRKRDTGEQGNKGQFGTVTRGEAEIAAPPGQIHAHQWR